jgi:hypothetical protein
VLGMQALGMIEGIETAARRVNVHEVRESDESSRIVLGGLRSTFATVYQALKLTFRELQG